MYVCTYITYDATINENETLFSYNPVIHVYYLLSVFKYLRKILFFNCYKMILKYY